MVDVYEPLSRYRDEFRATHAEHAKALYDSLVKQSGVDIDANRKTVLWIRWYENEITKASGHRKGWLFLRGCCIVGIVLVLVLMGIALFQHQQGDDPFLRKDGFLLCLFVLAGALTVWLTLCSPKLRTLDERLTKLKAEREKAEQHAWAQMAPLNRLFDWSQPTQLIQKTVPRLEFDPYFSVGRLNDLHRVFGWDDSYSKDRSVLFSHSGEINGNPFVFGETLKCEIRLKKYEGTRTITWTEQRRDSKGKSYSVVRTQTLHASIQKPCPFYDTDKILIFGNEAAPTLTFSRSPSTLSTSDDSVFSRMKMKREIRKLEAFSRNLEDDSNYTIMANREFEALFHAVDRSDEVQFRLLFTPLAQQQMLELLKDRSVGYGDDFAFAKIRRINLLASRHLNQMNLSTDPRLFQSYDLEASRETFLLQNQEFFRCLYFSLAPLLAIPLYQQTRTHEDIYKSENDRASSFWEHESFANYLGFEKFKPKNCITECILKTSVTEQTKDSQTVAVTAHGFRGEKRTEHVSVLGGDGRFHDVPVHWVEYFNVERTTPILIADTAIQSVQEFEQRAANQAGSPETSPCPWDLSSVPSIFRRGCIAAFGRKY